MDRTWLWRAAAYDYLQVKDFAPDGFEAVVAVFLAGREDPLEVHGVQTTVPSNPWIRLDSSEDRDENGKWEEDDCWVHVPESTVMRVEVRFRRVGKKPFRGFTHDVAPQEPASA